jgi:hypothetical protein
VPPIDYHVFFLQSQAGTVGYMVGVILSPSKAVRGPKLLGITASLIETRPNIQKQCQTKINIQS